MKTRNARHTRRRLLEPLESRQMLALTIITPDEGASFPAWAYDMGTAIVAHDGLYDQRDADGNDVVDLVQNSRVDLFGPVAPVGAGQVARDLALYDWTLGSNTPGNADEMTVALVDWITARLESVPMQEMHFIGHGRGALVNMEVLRQLAQSPLADRIGFVQMTTLDPFARGADGVIEFNPGGLVDFADNYYQDIDAQQLEHGGPILGALNFNLSAQLADWNGRTGTLADHHAVHDWYHWTIDSATTAADAPELADADLPVPTSEDRALLYDSYAADLDGNDTPDDFGGGAYLGYYFTVAGGGIGNVGGDFGLSTIDVARRTAPLALGLFLDPQLSEVLQGIGYAPNGDLYAMIAAANHTGEPHGLYRIQLRFDEQNNPLAERTLVAPVEPWDTFEFPFEFRTDGQIVAGAPGINMPLMQRWHLSLINPASGVKTPLYEVAGLPFPYPMGLALDHVGNVYLSTPTGGSSSRIDRISSTFDADATIPVPAGKQFVSMSVVDGLLYGIAFVDSSNGTLFSMNLATGQIVERGPIHRFDSLASVHSLRQPRWHNRELAQDVDANGRVNSTDVLAVINTLLLDGARAPAANELFAYHYDVTNDGRINTSDILAVINHILLNTEASATPAAESEDTSVAERVSAEPLAAANSAISSELVHSLAFALALRAGEPKDNATRW